MLYLYSKDICGFEFCERFANEEELQKYCFEHLPQNYNYMIVGVVYPEDAPNAWEADEDSSPNMRAIAACVEQAEKEGLRRPFWVVSIVCTGGCEYEAIQSEEDVDFYSLCKAWEDRGHYRIPLCRYASGEITPEQAEKEKKYLLANYIREDDNRRMKLRRGMYLLAEYIREDLGSNNEDNDNDNE